MMCKLWEHKYGRMRIERVKKRTFLGKEYEELYVIIQCNKCGRIKVIDETGL